MRFGKSLDLVVEDEASFAQWKREIRNDPARSFKGRRSPCLRRLPESCERKLKAISRPPSCSANADPPMNDETVGLHLQQAVEKATKALMTWKNIKYPFTHDIPHALASTDRKRLSGSGALLRLGYAHALRHAGSLRKSRPTWLVRPCGVHRSHSPIPGVVGHLALTTWRRPPRATSGRRL